MSWLTRRRIGSCVSRPHWREGSKSRSSHVSPHEQDRGQPVIHRPARATHRTSLGFAGEQPMTDLSCPAQAGHSDHRVIQSKRQLSRHPAPGVGDKSHLIPMRAELNSHALSRAGDTQTEAITSRRIPSRLLPSREVTSYRCRSSVRSAQGTSRGSRLPGRQLRQHGRWPPHRRRAKAQRRQRVPAGSPGARLLRNLPRRASGCRHSL